MPRVIVEQQFPEPISDEDYQRFADRVDPCLAERHAAWRRSYMSSDRRRTVCEFDAVDAETVREAYRNANVPFTTVWTATVFAVEDYPDAQKRLDETLRKRSE